MSLKYNDINFTEPNDDTYRKIKASSVLSLRELEFLSYLVRFQPCTIEFILNQISTENKSYPQSKVMGFNKITKPFKDLEIINVKGYEKPPKGRKKEIIQITGIIPKARKRKKDPKLNKIIRSSIESAILAIEVYNKPRVSFRAESYLTLMNIAWTKIMHAYFRKFQGDVYYYKDKNNKFIKKDGEKQTWSLAECIDQHKKFTQGTQDNLKLAIRLRNKIVHGHIDSNYLEGKIFGQLQALLHNYEKFLKAYFDGEHELDSNIHFSLQISTEITSEQLSAIKAKLSSEVKQISEYIDKYNSTIAEESFQSQDYSFRVALSPFTPNSGRNADVSVVFTSGISEEELEKITVLNKYKTIEVINAGKHLPMSIVQNVQKQYPSFNMNHHSAYFNVFKIRPSGDPKKMTAIEGSKTNQKYCHYDAAVKLFLYTDEWIAFILRTLKKDSKILEKVLEMKKGKKHLKSKEYI